MKSPNNLILLILFISINTFYTQTPSYFTIGEKELGGAEVYSILETKSEFLYVATDIGLFKYEKNKFISIQRNEKQIRNSLFNLRENKKGEVFCSNLSGQIFIINEKKLDLFAEVPQSSLSINTFMEFDKKGNLIVLSKDCFRVTKDSIHLIKIRKRPSYLSKLYNNNLLLHIINNDSIFLIKNDSIHYYSSEKKPLLNLYNKTKKREKKLLINTIKPNINENFCQINQNEVWGLDKYKGIRAITIVNDTIKEKSIFLKDIFISTLNKGSSSIFLGTFGQGVLVIPNHNIVINIEERNSEKIKDIAVDHHNNVFFTKKKEGIYHYKKNKRPIDYSPNYHTNYDNIFILPNINLDINQKFPELFYEKQFLSDEHTHIKYVKDICYFNNNAILFATGNGVSLIEKNKLGQSKRLKDTCNWVNYYNSSKVYYHKKINVRCVSITADSVNNEFYIATTSSIYRFGKDTKQEILYNNKNIICNDLLFYKNKLWCATKNEGILVFENGKFSKAYNTENGLINNSISQIRINNHYLYLNNEDYIQTINLSTNKVKTFGSAEGLFGIINDFELSNDKLWLLIDKTSIKSINIEDLKYYNTKLKIYLDSIVVSNEILTPKRLNTFNYEKNHFSFYVNVRSIKYQNHVIIKYRISGLEKNWNSLDANNGIIEYKSLPPGKYTFGAFAQYGNTKSKLVVYSFYIQAPYWQQWWFYLTISIIIIASVLLIIRVRVQRIRIKNKELIEKQDLKTNLIDSELKALRSQMNPHFIFNALNSIQDLILKEETDASYDYIVLFSELVRSTLNYSNKDFIPISSELEFIEVYLKLEKLRFEDDFNYSLNYKGSKNILAPSLIVQPFIENSLKHGLLHQSGKKILSVNFELSDQLICTIIDNGIGRVEARKIQKRQGNVHESFAIEAIGKRLEILNDQYGGNIGFDVIDLYKDNATGTKVILRIPFKNKY